MTEIEAVSLDTRKLKPIDEGKKPFLAALPSSPDSSGSPADSGTSSRLSSSSESALFSGGVPVGIRKPVKYQFEGRIHPGSFSSARLCPAHGPTRSSLTASTSRDLTSTGRASAFSDINGSSLAASVCLRGQFECKALRIPNLFGEPLVQHL